MASALLESAVGGVGEVHLTLEDAATWRIFIGDLEGEILPGVDLLLSEAGSSIRSPDSVHVDFLASPNSTNLTEIMDGTYIFQGTEGNTFSASKHGLGVFADLTGIAADPDIALWVRAGRYGAEPENAMIYIPEPASLPLLGAGALLLLRRRHSRR